MRNPNKIDKLATWKILKREKEDTHRTNIRNERGAITTDPTDIKGKLT